MRAGTGLVAGFVVGETLRRLRRPTFVPILALCALVSAYPQSLDSLRASLKGQTAASDFAVRLAASVDQAQTVEDAVSLLREFVPSVEDGESRRALYLRWAGLLELSGRWEEAAARYEDAAFASPGRRDTASLLTGARLWLAAGETDKALSILRVLGVASVDPAVRSTAQILEGWAGLLDGNVEEARTIAERSASGAPNPETLLAVLTLLWASSEGVARTKAADTIRQKFPGSPEAAMIETGDVPLAPHWLLTRASGTVRPEIAPKPGSPVPAVASSSPEPKTGDSKPTPPETLSDPAGIASVSSTRITAYQVGAFSEEQNAAALAKELGGKGFSPSILRKEHGGRPLWTVVVPAGGDPPAMLLRIKDAGYEAYPVF